MPPCGKRERWKQHMRHRRPWWLLYLAAALIFVGQAAISDHKNWSGLLFCSAVLGATSFIVVAYTERHGKQFSYGGPVYGRIEVIYDSRWAWARHLYRESG